MKERISKAVADSAEPADARYTIWDDELPGFGLRIERTGAKTFVVKYRGGGGGRNAPQRLMSLGRHPTVKVAEARRKAAKVLAAASLGHDPAGELAEKRRQMTVAALVDLYEEDGLVVQRGAKIGSPMKPLTAKYTMARLRHHVVPLLGSRRVAELTEGDIEAFVRAVAKGKTAKDEKTGPRKRIIVRGGEGAARKVVRDLSAVLSFAQRRRIISDNPVATASVRKTDGRRERFLTFEEVKRLGKALDELETAGARGPDKRGNRLEPANRKALNITRLWALTGCRRNEIAALEWSSVDLGRGLLIFDESKTGRSIRPLAAPAAALLEVIREAAVPGAAYVFPAERGDGHYTGTKRVWPEAVKRAGLPGVSPHTLRHTLGAAAASGGEGLLLVGAILGHANARSSQIYAHVDRDPARLAADRATAGIAAALGRPTASANDTHPVPQAANDAA
ncbi:MAG: integrase [Phenylobacterium sp.]|uniref:tyrosine-type recombinase/integrase n=1 Tax=Phenylobacterium sp. TaxID=1871053 RepID=UPI00260FDD41|nr:tyrosine-type recombinase/integrase [Phenylobacterium sp.]MDB5496887.1 integrase [Phenylobacterium sp.]